jgi:hypothetical protein
VTREIGSLEFDKSALVAEIMDEIRRTKPSLFEGFFYRSNAAAFVIASDIRAGILTIAKQEWLAAIDEVLADLSAITSHPLRTEYQINTFRKSIKQVIPDIESYDQLDS